MVSTEEEDEMPYDAYAQNLASEDSPVFEDKATREEKEEERGGGGGGEQRRRPRDDT